MRILMRLFLGFMLCLKLIYAEDPIKPVPLPSAEGIVVGATFSPDSTRVAIIRHIAGSKQRNTLQVVDLGSGREVGQINVLSDESASLGLKPHLISYSHDGKFLLLATKGSNIVLIVDSKTLGESRRITVDSRSENRKSLAGEGKRFFNGIVTLAVASNADKFAALTHDELGGNFVFVGSIASGEILTGWGLGPGRASTQVGEISIALTDDASKVAVSLLPHGNRLPKNFSNFQIYESDNGQIAQSIRTDRFIGQLLFLSGEEVLASRINSPGLFSKRSCLEEWSVKTAALTGTFCDPDRNVGAAFDVAQQVSRVVGVASQLHKSIEGQVYAASARVDVWDLKSKRLVAASSEMPQLISFVRVSPNGEWIIADQNLFHFTK